MSNEGRVDRVVAYLKRIIHHAMSVPSKAKVRWADMEKDATVQLCLHLSFRI
jgi:hypothetical protein